MFREGVTLKEYTVLSTIGGVIGVCVKYISNELADSQFTESCAKLHAANTTPLDLQTCKIVTEAMLRKINREYSVYFGSFLWGAIGALVVSLLLDKVVAYMAAPSIKARKKIDRLLKKCQEIKEVVDKIMKNLPDNNQSYQYTTNGATQINEILKVFNDEEQLTKELPNEFFCPITREIIREPVKTLDGYYFERIALQVWYDQLIKSGIQPKCIFNSTKPLTDPSKLEIDLERQKEILSKLDNLVKQDVNAGLHMAIIKGDVDEVKRYLKHGANPNYQIDTYSYKDIAKKVGVFCATGSLSMWKKMAFGDSKEEKKPIKGDTVLHLAVRLLRSNDKNRCAIVQELINKGANKDAQNDQWEKPIDLIPDAFHSANFDAEELLQPEHYMVTSPVFNCFIK